MNRILILTLLPGTLGASANCVTDAPEIGDIGPDSERVCSELESRFPAATLAVEGRAIHSPTEVMVSASVDGEPTLLDYRLTGYTWVLDDTGSRMADTAAPPPDPSTWY